MSDVEEAIMYFEEMGFIEDLTTDKAHYVSILIEHAKKTIDYEQNMEQTKKPD